MLEYSRNLKDPARELRATMTEAEQLLWSRLRRKQILGVPFYRQKPIGAYTVDFYAPSAKLVIEVDGSQHGTVEHRKRDLERDRSLAEMGLKVMRFDNLQVLNETDAVVAEICGVIEKRLEIPPDPPLSKGGGECTLNLRIKELGMNRLHTGEDSNNQSPPLTKGDSGGFDSDPVMLSALEHYVYCPRQCALIHIEQVWDENLYTMRGRDTHENVDEESSSLLHEVRYERALPIWSKLLNIVGKADMVEFHGDVPYPVEYKSGRRKRGHPETIQLCAQAICLEEIFDMPVPKGALYWHGSRERREVEFTDAIRKQVAEVARAVHEMVEKRITPPPVNDKRCKDCSLRESCLPNVVGEKRKSHMAAVELFSIKGGH